MKWFTRMKKKNDIIYNQKKFFLRLPTNHCGNTNEIIKNKNTQLIMYYKTSNDND